MKKLWVLPVVLLVCAFSVFSYIWTDCDFNNDGYVNLQDHSIFGAWYTSNNCTGNNSYCAGTDINEDGSVNLADYSIFGQFYNCYENSTNESGCWG